MKALVSVCALLLSTLASFATDGEVASKLEAVGAKVTLQDGAISQLAFTDCSQLGDAEFKAIGQLANLKNLTLFGGKQKLTDETLPHLLGLKQLEQLATEGAKLSDEALARISELTNLRSASFYHLSFRLEGFTGKGFAAWKKLPRLEKLTVAGMSMGDEGFAAIAQIQTLRDFATWHTYQTEAGNAEIAKLPLKTLKVGQRLPRKGAPPSFTDESLSTFARIKTLETLKLTEGRLSLAGLKALKALPSLKLLQIAESEVSPADLEALKQELSSVKVEFTSMTEEQQKKLGDYLRE